MTTRDRLNRSGDRQLNRALHTIVLNRLRYDPQVRSDLGHSAAGLHQIQHPPAELGRVTPLPMSSS